MNTAELPVIPHYPAGISGGGAHAIVSYTGPPRWELPDKIARQRRNHADNLRRARDARRIYGAPGIAAMYLGYARMSRLQLRSLLASERALNTVWRERLWMPYAEYRAITNP